MKKDIALPCQLSGAREHQGRGVDLVLEVGLLGVSGQAGHGAQQRQRPGADGDKENAGRVSRPGQAEQPQLTVLVVPAQALGARDQFHGAIRHRTAGIPDSASPKVAAVASWPASWLQTARPEGTPGCGPGGSGATRPDRTSRAPQRAARRRQASPRRARSAGQPGSTRAVPGVRRACPPPRCRAPGALPPAARQQPRGAAAAGGRPSRAAGWRGYRAGRSVRPPHGAAGHGGGARAAASTGPHGVSSRASTRVREPAVTSTLCGRAGPSPARTAMAASPSHVASAADAASRYRRSTTGTDCRAGSRVEPVTRPDVLASRSRSPE